MFLWNSLHDALLVGEQFSIRNITLSSQCLQCTEAELVLYMLFTCGYSQEVWRLSPLATNFEPSLTTTTCEGLDLFRRSYLSHPSYWDQVHSMLGFARIYGSRGTNYSSKRGTSHRRKLCSKRRVKLENGLPLKNLSPNPYLQYFASTRILL